MPEKPLPFTDFGKSELCTTEKPNPALRKIGTQDFGKTELRSSENRNSGLRKFRTHE
jgi:hypothetical protein